MNIRTFLKSSLVLSAGVVLLLSCSRKNSPSETPSVPVAPPLPRFDTGLAVKDTLVDGLDTLLYYQRSACFGFCPTFNYTVYDNGIVRYQGLQHVDWMGTHYARISDAWWDEVKDSLRSSGFFELAPVYPVEPELYIPDLPNTVIVAKEYGLIKRVVDNHHAPKPLKRFEIFLEDHFRKLSFTNFEDR